MYGAEAEMSETERTNQRDQGAEYDTQGGRALERVLENAVVVQPNPAIFELPSLQQPGTIVLQAEQVVEWVDGVPESKEPEASGVEAETREGPITADQSMVSRALQLDVIDSEASSQFARLVRGWETYIDHGTKKVQRGLQTLNLCGEGLTRIGGPTAAATGGASQDAEDDEEDMFAPIVLRHTHSSPLHYSTMFDENDPPPATGLEQMRRSNSTPSTSAFRQRSEGSAFGTNLRSMPHLSGPDDRSAFTLPMNRSTYASMSDSGVRYSAFNPIPFARRELEETEQTSIEVTDMGSNDKDKKERQGPQKWHGAKKAKQFLKDNVRVLGRRRRRRSGRENPAGPPSVASSTKSVEVKVEQGGGGNDGTRLSDSADKKLPAKPSFEGNTEPREDRISPEPQPAFPVVREAGKHDVERERSESQESTSQYHHLDSDIDEEYIHYRGIEAIHDSPATVPSPVYQQFDDRGETPPASTVRIQTSARSPAHPVRLSTESPQPITVGRTASQDSGAESPGTATSTLTSNTSGQTTLGTSTSGTVSSRLTTLSAVSETDREVMETNKAGRGLRLQHESQNRQQNQVDGDATVHSSSTASTSTHAYLALGSPASLREGASMPMDRFFKASRIPVAHSESHNSGSSSSGASGGSSSLRNTRPVVETTNMKRMESHLTHSSANPFDASGTSMGKSVSSSSNSSDDPPKFVSYLDQQHSSDATKIVGRGTTRSSPPVLTSTREQEDCESPAQIVGYSHGVVFEAAKPDSQKLFRPVKKRERKFSARPPLSPIKGLRTPTTPPPHLREHSPIYQPLSPPPNIVNHHIQGTPDLSKPYVLRTNAPPPPRPNVVLVSPEQRGGASNPAVPSDDRESSETFPPYSNAASTSSNNWTPFLRSQQQIAVVGRSSTYRETSIEVEKDELAKEASPVNMTSPVDMTGSSAAVVSPEKQTGDASS